MAGNTASATEVAGRLDIDPKRLRAWMRLEYGDVHEKHQPWEIDEAMERRAAAHFWAFR